ncbi:MAG: YraN family protein, partial [Candidatus Staskawiczbacteria bacterium]|nr:YraN family protein [Candidatus Staskawiczbacteria bacterium]
ACEYLVKNGYKIIGRNYRINFGEIDIIAKKRGFFADKSIHFVEVKSLSNQGKDFFPEQRVDYKKQNKYKCLVEVWLTKNKFPQNYPCQVDVIAVSINGENLKIDHFENVVNDK